MISDYDETMDRDNSFKNKQDEIDDFEILNDAINDKRNEPDYQQLNNNNDDKHMKGLSIEIEFQGVGKIDQCVASITHFTMDLLEKWIKSKAIDGVVCLDNKSLLTSDFRDVQAWTVPPRIIEKKRSSLAELMLWVKTNKSAYELYDDQREFCDKFHIKIATKRTIIEYVNKMGYLTGTYVKLASAEYYINDISTRLNLAPGTIDIKKEYTYEKGKRSKVLVLYAISSEINTVNESLSKIINTRYQYVSYRKTTSEERLASMHHNEMMNIKARYESLHNAKLKERVFIESRRHERLETVLIKQQHNGVRLFLAAEQGSGRYENSVTIVINPKAINKAKQWIANEYLKLNFEEDKPRETSVDPEQFEVDTTYNDNLKEFLRPTLQTKDAKKTK